MDVILLSAILTLGVACGLNAYLTMATVGSLVYIDAQPFAGWVDGRLDVLGHPVLLSVLWGMFLVEFLADKVPAVDSFWDSAHTVIRPAMSVILALGLTQDMDFGTRLALLTVAGMGTLATHATKASVRAGVNTSPEPASNVVLSVAEDVAVAGLLYLVVKHPYIALAVSLTILAFIMWAAPKTFRFGWVRVLALLARVRSWFGQPSPPPMPRLAPSLKARVEGLSRAFPFYGAGGPFVRNRKGFAFEVEGRLLLWQPGWVKDTLVEIDTKDLDGAIIKKGLLLDQYLVPTDNKPIRLRLLKTWTPLLTPGPSKVVKAA